MDNRFDQASASLQSQGLKLSRRQAEICKNLQNVFPEIAAFYRDGIRILQNDDLETSAYLLAHLAREIEGGLRDVLSEKRKSNLEVVIQMPDGETLTHENGVEDTLEFVIDTPGLVKLTCKKIQGEHKASILHSLGVNENSAIAERWISLAKRFAKFAHRHGAWKAPRSKEAFVPLWHEFEGVLADLVGTYLNLLNRVDHLLAYDKPTKEIIKTLPNLLKPEAMRAYFFKKLDSPTWLEPLKDEGWFDPEGQPTSQEVPHPPGYYLAPIWHALGYVEKVSTHPDTPVGTVVKIVNDVVTYINNNQEQIMPAATVWHLVKIINILPTERLERQHITFMDWALHSGPPLLVTDEIGETLLPKLLNRGTKELVLGLLEVMLKDYESISVIEKQGEAIVELCGVKAVHVALKHIQNLIAADANTFVLLQPIEVGSSQDSDLDYYEELLVRFTSSLFRFAESDSIAETVEALLQESHEILRRIALTAVTHHYPNLKQLFWGWQGNPLKDISLKPELYQLLQTNCRTFDESEIEQILHWVESAQDVVSADDDENRLKAMADSKREWLAALMETGNEKVVSAYQAYEQINPANSPVTGTELFDRSNAQIADFLKGFEQKGISGQSIPTKRELAETLEECVALNPQRFADDLQPFQDVRNFYQYWILHGFLKAWREKRAFDWAKLLEFIHQIISSEQFWTKHHETHYGHSNWIFAAAKLIESGTRDDTHAFDVQGLPLAEKILLVLVEKVELGHSTIKSVPTAVVNSDRGKVFSAMVNYALRFARTNGNGPESRWPKAIRADFTKRLDRKVEPSFEFSFTLGAYLPNLLYLDKAWLIENIDRIFPQHDEYHWHVAFSGYLFYSRQSSEVIYSLFKKHGHYQRAISSDFCDQQVDARVLPETPVVYLDRQQIDRKVDRVVREKLVSHICLGWMKGWETLDDETSLIYQLVHSDNPNLLSALIHFFWRRRDNLPEEMKAKVRSAWRALFEALSQKSNIAEYQGVLSRLSRWVALVDKIDAEVLKWLKMSTQHIRDLTDSARFVKELLPHARKTPTAVGEIYLGMLTHNVYPPPHREHVQEIIRVLYSTRHKAVADRICNLYGEAGFDSVKSLYDENQNREK